MFKKISTIIIISFFASITLGKEKDAYFAKQCFEYATGGLEWEPSLEFEPYSKTVSYKYGYLKQVKGSKYIMRVFYKTKRPWNEILENETECEMNANGEVVKARSGMELKALDMIRKLPAPKTPKE